MTAKSWNPAALEESLAMLYETEQGSLHGRYGEIAVACRKLGEMRVLWLCFEEYEGLPHGVGKASRTDALAFLGWARRPPELRRRGPPRGWEACRTTDAYSAWPVRHFGPKQGHRPCGVQPDSDARHRLAS